MAEPQNNTHEAMVLDLSDVFSPAVSKDAILDLSDIFYSPDQPRDDHGRWVDGGSGQVSGELYHGTSEGFARMIMAEGLRRTQGVYGYGVYATADVRVALGYGKKAAESNHANRDNLVAAVVVTKPAGFENMEDATGYLVSPDPVPPENIVRVEFYKIRDLQGDYSQAVPFEVKKRLSELSRQSELYVFAGLIRVNKSEHLFDPAQPRHPDGKFHPHVPKTIHWNGYTIRIENPAGSVRRGEDQSGEKWRQKMTWHYGYIDGLVGEDGDGLDCFVGTNLDVPEVYCARIINAKGDQCYDEDKLVIGATSRDEARSVILDNYDDPMFFESLESIPVREFGAWAKAHLPARLSEGAAGRMPPPDEQRPSSWVLCSNCAGPIKLFNPNHVPAGSPEGGQFAPAEGGTDSGPVFIKPWSGGPEDAVFHGTIGEFAKKIQSEGINPSTSGLHGPGVYGAKDRNYALDIARDRVIEAHRMNISDDKEFDNLRAALVVVKSDGFESKGASYVSKDHVPSSQILRIEFYRMGDAPAGGDYSKWNPVETLTETHGSSVLYVFGGIVRTKATEVLVDGVTPYLDGSIADQNDFQPDGSTIALAQDAKPFVWLDCDGTLFDKEHPFNPKSVGPVSAKGQELVAALRPHFDLVVHTARSDYEPVRKALDAVPEYKGIEITNVKPYEAIGGVDDRVENIDKPVYEIVERMKSFAKLNDVERAALEALDEIRFGRTEHLREKRKPGAKLNRTAKTPYWDHKVLASERHIDFRSFDRLQNHSQNLIRNVLGGGNKARVIREVSRQAIEQRNAGRKSSQMTFQPDHRLATEVHKQVRRMYDQVREKTKEEVARQLKKQNITGN